MTPSSADELEICIVGPGYGECVVVHVGEGDWIVVDSCMPAGIHLPAALEYLSDLGVDPAVQVRLVVASHWHDDHVGGIAQVLEACSLATFVRTPASAREEMLLCAFLNEAPGADPQGNGLREFLECQRIVESRRRRRAKGLPHAVVHPEAWTRIFAHCRRTA